jgi:peptide/nickel transport system permease protein
MGRLLLIRVIWGAFTVLAVLTLVFIVVRSTEGDPTAAYLPLEATAQQRAEVERQLGVDKPLPVQYAKFLQKVVLEGDFGNSVKFHDKATTLVFERLPNTLKLGALAFAITVLLGIPLGVLSAVREGSWIDLGVRAIATAGQALPSFVLAVLLVLVFAVNLRWLPVNGTGSFDHYILPALSLAWFPIAALTRVVRSSMLDVLRQDYVRTARAKGLSARAILISHAFRNALIPIVTLIGVLSTYFVGGAVIVETIFAWPGLGRLLIEAALSRDFAIVEAATFFLALIFILINLLTDLSYYWLDPRLRIS